MDHFSFFGQWSPHEVDRVLLHNYFLGKEHGFFIECGAATGKEGSNCYFFEKYLHWKGINIEASPLAFSKLAQNRPKSININAALSTQDGKAVFHDVINQGAGAENGSLQFSEDHLEELEGYNCQFQDIEVKTITYQTLMNEHFSQPIDLFSLDVEGFEVEVLKSMKNSPEEHLPTVICAEYPYVGLKPLKEAAFDLGYEFDFISYNNAFFSRMEKKRTVWFGQTNTVMVWDKNTKSWRPDKLENHD